MGNEYKSREALLEKVKSSISVPTDNEWDCGYNTAMAEMLEFIKQMPSTDVQPAPKWISVKERLPEAVEKNVDGKITFSDFVLVYLVCDDGFTYITNDKCIVDSKLWLHEIPDKDCKVTHWMPLPEPPKNDDAEDRK